MKLKKALICALSISLLAACGNQSEEPNNPQKVEQKQNSEEIQEVEEKVSDDKEVTKEAKSDSVFDYVGKTYDADGALIDVLKGGSIDQTFEQGPFKITVEGIYIGRIKNITDEDLKAYYNTDEPVNIAVISYKVENTSDDTYTFYIGQSPITTDTKEQIEPDLLVSEEGGGDILGQIIKEGNSVYYPKNNLEDIKDITWHLKHANSEDYQTKIDGIKIKFIFDEKGSIESAEEVK